ncbi:formylmethanofuran dehydrogenase subunit C [Telmatocola sphagniphila]|jgi:formylmethanofuran dehydrogenase subunit C|uniref:Formylmethanofuran dehydrogenase subunit C n=1 Tax=Telmatocola sphagniphila TaxID=1123043 RepID=A0A8E6B553_9BACT|nr:formylmethanofuran dehydrogenase subunit C [Telmatocola sphagniphila]QVL31296.1 formylmethanofuran dehydrogenase subunit C [Telmatocola sphagniphila]
MLRLILKSNGPIPLEADSIRPNVLQTLSLMDIRKLPIWQGRNCGLIEDFFDLDGDPTDGTIELLGDCSNIKRLGERMSTGTLIIRGSAGMHLGAGMQGGLIDVYGGAEDWLGAGMQGGTIRVRSHAGDLVGAAYRGESRGMAGGTILIDGHAGDEVGAHMRRGTIAVAGNCGDFVGISMIAGTILVGGDLGKSPGAGMKRGSLIALGKMSNVSPGFTASGEYQPNFLGIYTKFLKSKDFPLPKLTPESRYIRYVGDRVSAGKGEILVRI